MNPVIKWAGGKRRFAEAIVSILGRECEHYYEPFVGGAAILLFMEVSNATCSDTNEELINFYNVLKDNPEELITELSTHYFPNHSKDFYYKIRSLDRDRVRYNNLNAIQRAARFLYLNKTCYNGLWRVNRNGQNNVPFGRYAHPTILPEESIREVSRYFNEENISFEVSDYRLVAERAQAGDIVYFDPPYDVENGQNGFVEYTQDGFNREDQRRLKTLCDVLVERGVRVGISNSNTQFIRELYTEGPYDFYEVFDDMTVKRTIGATAESRREMSELFILGTIR